jgi:hypothetical protein
VVYFFAALGTVGAVILALFNDKIFRPHLRLNLLSPVGEKSPVQSGMARYYHLKVSNTRGRRPATNVQVYLLNIEEKDSDGNLQTIWKNEIPLGWRWQPDMLAACRT